MRLLPAHSTGYYQRLDDLKQANLRADDNVLYLVYGSPRRRKQLFEQRVAAFRRPAPFLSRFRLMRPLNGLVHRHILLISGDLFDGPAATQVALEHHEVTHDIEEIFPRQQAVGKHLLRIRLLLAQALGHLFLGQRKETFQAL